MSESKLYECCGGVGTHTQKCPHRCGRVFTTPGNNIDTCGKTIAHTGRCDIRDAMPNKHETINHPNHYGGADNPYEVIKVIDAWGLGFCLGNTLKYVYRAGKKPQRLDISTSDKPNQFMDAPADLASTLEDLRKAAWYLNHEIEQREKK